MKKLKYFLFLFPFCFSLNVFADTSYDMTSLITSPVNYSECGVGSYTGVELNGATNCWNTKTRYQGTLNRIYFNLPSPSGSSFENDTSYRLTLKMATNDWRNNFGSPVVSPGSSYTNNFVDTFNFVSKQQINITFTVPYSGSITYQTLYVNIPAVNSSSLITGDSNWNLSSVTLTKLTSGSSGGSTSPSGPSTSFDDTGIINNANENTQDIINNNNTNTQDIINNANENTNSLNESINDNCKNTTLTLTDDLSSSLNSYLDNNGSLHIYSGASVSTYIKVRPNTSYTLKKITGGDVPTGFSYCLYNANKARYRCELMPVNQNEEIIINVDSYTTFIRFSMLSYRVYQLKGFICNDFISENINEVNDSINSLNEDITGAVAGAVSGAVQNTQDIINNNNENTNKINETIVDEFNNCVEQISSIPNTYIASGNLNSSVNFASVNGQNVYVYKTGATDKVYSFDFSSANIPGKSSIRIASSNTLYTSFDSNADLTLIYQGNNPSVVSFNVSQKYFYIYFYKSGSTDYIPTFGKEYCINRLDDTKNAINDVNDSINDTNNYLKDDSDPTIDDSVLNDVFGRVHFTDPLSYLLTLPTQLINKIVSLSDTCSPIDLGTLYGVHLTLPCINLENYLGSDLWTIIDVILSVGLLSVILKNFYDTISNLLTLGGEKEAKEKFSMPTPMDFLAMILGGDRQ